MSDEGQIVTGGSTAGLREAAMAKRAAAPAAKAPDASQAPQFAKGKPTPSADSAADDGARAQHRKLPTKARAEQQAPEDDGDLAALAGDDDAPAAPSASGETIRIGDHEIPISVLEQLPDEALARIKRKIKSGGSELTITLAEALAEVPKAHGWQKRMWEASQQEKKLEAIARRLGDDPVAGYMALHDITRDQAIERLSGNVLSHIQREQMTPEQRAEADRMAQLEAKARRHDELEDAERKRVEGAEQTRLRAKHIADMTPALEAAGLKATGRNVRDVANMVATMIDNGIIRGVPTQDDLRWAASELRKEQEAEDTLPDDVGALVARLGEKRAREVARHVAKQVQAKAAPVQRSEAAKPRPSGKAQSWAEFQREANAKAKKDDRAAGRR
jgi:hypothetical protein